MASSTLRDNLPLLVPLAGLIALVPNEAEACSPDPCNNIAALDDIVGVGPAIPIDGVLVLRTTGVIDDNAVLAGLELTVTRDGQPIAGAVEDSSAIGVLVWRPAAQLVPGAYDVHAKFDNPPIDYEYCGQDVVEKDFGFTVGPDPAEPLKPPTSLPGVSGNLFEDRELDTLVCCDGAFPEDYNQCGYSYYVSWFDGECAELSAVGYLDVSFELTQNVAPATASQLVRTLRIDGDVQRLDIGDVFHHRSDKPFCASFDLTNLATSETLAGPEQCFGDADVEIKLGKQALDPSIALAGKCTGAPYTCEVGDGFPPKWDPEKCTPWEPTEDPTGETGAGTGEMSASDTTDQDGLGDRGCGCTTGPADPSVLLGLAGLGLLAGRRRRRD